MELHHCRYTSSSIKILTFSFPLFFFLLHCAASSFTTTTSTAPTPLPSSSTSSFLAAAETLRTHGYSLYASALISTFSTTSNLSGTILAAPDFIFTFSPSLTSRALPRPSTTLLLYHSIKPPSLRWLDLITRPNGDELRTLHSGYCLYLFNNPNGDVSIASSKKPILAVNIRQPDLYVDENLAIHGVDGVLDPSTADKCSPVSTSDPTMQIQSWVHRSFLDRAIRALRRRGFHVAAAGLALRRPDLLTLPAVTVFAPSDKVLFTNPDGFRYDARRHIVPERLRFDKLMSFTEGTEFVTLAPNKTIFIESGSDLITVNGVRIDGVELYLNRWVILYSIEPTTLDDVAKESPDVTKWVDSPLETEGQIPGDISNNSGTGIFSIGVPTAATVSTGNSIGPPSPAPGSQFLSQIVGVPTAATVSTGNSIGPPSPAPGSQFLSQIEIGVPGVSSASGQESVEDAINELFETPSPSQSLTPVISGTTDTQCDVFDGVTVGVDSSDLFCPVNDALNMENNEEIQSVPDVAQFEPLDGVAHYKITKKLLQSEPLISAQNDRTDEDEVTYRQLSS